MYDHIRLHLNHTFENDNERKKFCERYHLCEFNEHQSTYNNSTETGLKQCRGVYVKMRLSNRTSASLSNRSSTSLTDRKDFGDSRENRGLRVGARNDGGTQVDVGLMFSFSLHKFYNFSVPTVGEYLNWDDFSFGKANRAKTMFCDMFPMCDFSRAKVTTYEVGINIQLPRPPQEYMEQLRELRVKERNYPIVVDRHQKDYMQYGTFSKGRRIVYIWYDKTYEARSKMRSNLVRYVVPENILRCEKDNRVPIQKTMFFDLFKKEFQRLTANEFRKRFVDDIFFAERVPKVCQRNFPDLGKAKLAILEEILRDLRDLKDIRDAGERVFARIEKEYNAGMLPRRTYYRRVAEVKEVLALLPGLPKEVLNENVDYENDYKMAVRAKMEVL
ncbi:MAG: hypothetical protein LBN27_02025 [Prevotellaceae bacterium]|jgi:hypothetical protein|nr:hypothetical protein [Prevotellaceae bacterium]